MQTHLPMTHTIHEKYCLLYRTNAVFPRPMNEASYHGPFGNQSKSYVDWFDISYHTSGSFCQSVDDP